MKMSLEAFGERRTFEEWSELTGLKERVIKSRLDAGATPELALSIPRCAHVSIKAPPGAPRSWTWACLDFDDDEWAQRFVRKHPEGATCDDVAAALGVTHNAVSLEERKAVAKLLAAVGEATLRRVLGSRWLRARPEARVQEAA